MSIKLDIFGNKIKSNQNEMIYSHLSLIVSHKIYISRNKVLFYYYNKCLIIFYFDINTSKNL